jgi:hypothetical protein
MQGGEIHIDWSGSQVRSLGFAKVELSARNRQQNSRRQSVAGYRFRIALRRNMQQGLGAVMTRKSEIRMPADAHGFSLIADPGGLNLHFHSISNETDRKQQIGCRKPPPFEIACMQHARDGLSAGGRCGSQVAICALWSRP